MKILQLHAGYRIPAGEDSVVANEAAAMSRAGHSVTTHIVPNPVDPVGALKALALSSHNARRRDEVESIVRDVRPDIVHVHNTWFSLSSSVVSAAGDTPTVMTLHNYRLGCLGADLFRGDSVCTACVGQAPLRGVLHGCYRGSRALSAVAATEVMVTRRRRTLLDGIDRFVSPSAFMADRLIDIGIPADRLVVKPHFVADPGERHTPPSASTEVLYVGRLAPGKGLDTLMRSWERFASGGNPEGLTLTIIGDGPLAPALRECAPRGVRFEGWVPHADVTDRLLSARAFVFPSVWYEPFGMVLVEALSAGLPIITTEASEAPAITAARAPLLVPVADEEALVRALGALSAVVADEVGAANRRRFEQHYTEAVGVQLLEELYEDVIIAAGRPLPLPAQ